MHYLRKALGETTMTPPEAPMSQAMSEQAYKTPIQDLLRAIPADLIIQWTDKEGLKAWHNCPIGREAHEAAALIEQQSLELQQANAKIANLQQINTAAGVVIVEQTAEIAQLKAKAAELGQFVGAIDTAIMAAETAGKIIKLAYGLVYELEIAKLEKTISQLQQLKSICEGGK